MNFHLGYVLIDSSSCPEEFCKKGVLKNFAKRTKNPFVAVIF